MSATAGSANSQSASEQGESAKRERALRTRLASSCGQLTKRTEQGARRAQARATCFGSEALVLTAENRKVFQDIPCRELSDEARHNSAASPQPNAARPAPQNPAPGAVGQRTTYQEGRKARAKRPPFLLNTSKQKGWGVSLFRPFDPPGTLPRWPGPFPTGGFFVKNLRSAQENIWKSLNAKSCR